jgi:hypothetical protein
MKNLTKMTEAETRTCNGGGKQYGCLWNDYWNTNF